MGHLWSDFGAEARRRTALRSLLSNAPPRRHWVRFREPLEWPGPVPIGAKRRQPMRRIGRRRRRDDGFGHLKRRKRQSLLDRVTSVLDPGRLLRSRRRRHHIGAKAVVSPSARLGSAPVRTLGDGRSSASAHESAPAFPNDLRCEPIRRRDCLSALPSKRNLPSVCDSRLFARHASHRPPRISLSESVSSMRITGRAADKPLGSQICDVTQPDIGADRRVAEYDLSLGKMPASSVE